MQRALARLLRKKQSALFALAAPVLFATLDGAHLSALPPRPAPRAETTPEQLAIEAQPVCIGSLVSSAGVLDDVLYYHAIKRPDGRIAVGYFAFWSEERPWGNNWLTWSFLPALSVDLVYSRALLVAPGLQRAMYGLGDVEGVSVVYAEDDRGTLHPEEASGEDRTEHTVPISRAEMFALDPKRPTFYTDIWSHQLAGRGARTLKDLQYVRCYDKKSIRPLPESVSAAFRVENRAGPAHVEQTGGTRLDVAEPPEKLAAAGQ
jgi:hypothetical protein